MLVDGGIATGCRRSLPKAQFPEHLDGGVQGSLFPFFFICLDVYLTADSDWWRRALDVEEADGEPRNVVERVLLGGLLDRGYYPGLPDGLFPFMAVVLSVFCSIAAKTGSGYGFPWDLMKPLRIFRQTILQ